MSSINHIVNTGNMKSVADLSNKISSFLKEFSTSFIRGENIDFKWYMGNLAPGYISLTALATFLSISHRMRAFKGSPTDIVFEWRPHVFTILHDLGFFEISKELELHRWDDLVVENFKKGVLNPKSLLAFFGDEAPDKNDLMAWRNWKDVKRKEFYNDLKYLIEPIFEEHSSRTDSEFIDLICQTTSELSVNCIMHGKEFAFVGLQVQSGKVIVSVCDSGVGFKSSINKVRSRTEKLSSDVEAIIIGSIINPREIGLFESISQVTTRLGTVEISSFGGEVFWSSRNWDIVKNLSSDVKIDVSKILGPPVESRDFPASQTGYWREIKELRGTRITFKIPFE